MRPQARESNLSDSPSPAPFQLTRSMSWKGAFSHSPLHLSPPRSIFLPPAPPCPCLSPSAPAPLPHSSPLLGPPAPPVEQGGGGSGAPLPPLAKTRVNPRKQPPDQPLIRWPPRAARRPEPLTAAAVARGLRRRRRRRPRSSSPRRLRRRGRRTCGRTRTRRWSGAWRSRWTSTRCSAPSSRRAAHEMNE